jgi:hypothetical protein
MQYLRNNTENKLNDILLKKYLNIPASQLLSDPNLEITLSNRSYIISNEQLFSDSIPTIAPTDLSDRIISIDKGQKKEVSTRFNHIVKYTKLQLVPIQTTSSGNITFWSKGPTALTPRLNILRYAIPYNYDPAASYDIIVYISNNSNRNDYNSYKPVSQDGGNELNPTEYYPWIIDVDSGILTFITGLPPNYYVAITFWRYEGRFGFQSVIADAPKLIFDGGVPSTNFNENVGNVVVISGGGPG